MHKNSYFYVLYPKSRSNMTEKESALYSHYIIDGIRQEATPAELLEECMEYDEAYTAPAQTFNDIIDESTEPPLSSFSYDINELDDYLALTTKASKEERSFRMLYPRHFTALQITKALIGRLWNEGHFRLGNLNLWGQWEWNTRPLGNMAAFYESASAAGEYIYNAEVKLRDYLFIEEDGECRAKFYAWLPEMNEESLLETDADEPKVEIDIDDKGNQEIEVRPLFKSSPYESKHPWISESRKCPSEMNDDPDSWIIYIPFDTCQFRLGGSLFAQVMSRNGGQAPEINDPYYFIDCFEVVRELVEDGVIKAGITIADGGMATAAARFCGDLGLSLDLNGISSSYQENDRLRILFGEVPGVIIQIEDSDYDYVDSQMILQDIAYYPIGHPCREFEGIRIKSTQKNGVADILASLLGQASEGED